MTIEELYDKIVADDELKEAAAKAAESGNIAEWAREQGVEATEDEIVAFVNARSDEKLDIDDVDEVAGGTWKVWASYIHKWSVCSIEELIG